MRSHSLTATYTGITVPEDRWWVRLEQIPVRDDVATVRETASFLDAAFNIDPCEQSATTEETHTVTNAATATEETVVEAAGASFDLAICNQDPDGAVEIQIKVIRSHQTENYRLHVAGGSIVSTLVVPEELSRVDTVESATSLELDYPVIGAFAASWQNDLVTASSSAPEIRRNGNTLYWAELATGSIQSSYLTTYDLVTIRVDGSGGEHGAATIRVVFHALAEDLVPELPDPADLDRTLCPKYRWRFKDTEDVVTCYKEITLTTRCSCSGREVGYRTYDQVVPCPDWIEECTGNVSECMVLLGSEAATEYVECAGDNEIPGSPGMVYSVSKASYYEEVCCKSAPENLPDCLEKITSYRGGKPIALGQDHYRDLYGQATRFVAVSPKGGICGQHITRQVVRSGNCCEGVTPIALAASPSTMEPGSDALIKISGGRPPYLWRITGIGMTFYMRGYRLETIGPEVRIHAASFACGYAEVTVTDGCTELSAGTRVTVGAWEQVGAYFSGDPAQPLSAATVLSGYCGTALVSSGLYLGYTYDGSKSQFSANNRYWMGGGTELPGDNPVVPGRVGVPFQYAGVFNTKGVPLGSGCLDGYAPPDPLIGVFNPVLATGCFEYSGGMYSRTPSSSIVIYQWGC